jgi:hypothetical protein
MKVCVAGGHRCSTTAAQPGEPCAPPESFARLTDRQALAQLTLLTSYDAYRELRHAGLSDREPIKTPQEDARTLLL